MFVSLLFSLFLSHSVTGQDFFGNTALYETKLDIWNRFAIVGTQQLSRPHNRYTRASGGLGNIGKVNAKVSAPVIAFPKVYVAYTSCYYKNTELHILQPLANESLDLLLSC